MNFSCPLPLTGSEQILLGHGSGGTLSAALLREIVMRSTRSLPRLGGAWRIRRRWMLNGTSLAFTTDSVRGVSRCFPRRRYRLACTVHGTINDLAMGGARPIALSVAMILEEGFAVAELQRIAQSIGAAARACGVPIVTGDTKVVEKGSGDGIFINTTGIGIVPKGSYNSRASATRVRGTW